MFSDSDNGRPGSNIKSTNHSSEIIDELSVRPNHLTEKYANFWLWQNVFCVLIVHFTALAGGDGFSFDKRKRQERR